MRFARPRHAVTRTLVTLAGLALIGAAVANPASAHGTFSHAANNANGDIVNIDGTIGQAEWADASFSTIDFGGVPASLYLKHNGTYLFAAVKVSGTGAQSVSFFFDDDHDGVKDVGEDAIGSYVGSATAQGNNDFFWDTSGVPGTGGGAGHYPDTYVTGSNLPAGTLDVVGAGTQGANEASFEVRHQLCTSDTAHDFCVTPGQTLGFMLQYQTSSLALAQYPSGTSPTNPSNWADMPISTGTSDGPASPHEIAFVTNRNGNYDVYTATADGTGTPLQITSDPGTDFVPAWSPDGTKIAFSSGRDGDSEIYIANADGSGTPTKVTDNTLYESDPAWSPHGTKIAFTRGEYIANGIANLDVYTKNLSTGAETLVTSTGVDDWDPDWSPDGTKIAFASDRDGDREVFVTAAAGGGTATNLTNNTDGD